MGCCVRALGVSVRRLQSFGLLGAVFLLACGKDYYRESADREVYGIIQAKSRTVGGMPAEFTIEEKGEGPVPAAEVAPATWVISLREAIEIAVENSRTYQSEKEALYSGGLALSSARHQFDPIPFGVASGEVEGGEGDNTASSVISFGLNKMLATGADLSISITTSLFRVISGGDPREVAASTINASLVQPLLRGAGRRVVLEDLTQAERDMVYSIRDFVRFRREFSVDVAKSYYNLLQQRDQVENARENYESLRRDSERAELMAKAGRLPEFQVDQTRQDELSARDRWIRAVESYANALDVFKIDLGLPTETLLEPDPAELAELSGRVGVEELPPLDGAVSTALQRRLDLKNQEDRVGDSERKVVVAENALKAGLDLVLAYQADTEGETTPLRFSGGDERYSAGLDADLPLDRKFERNAYRQSLINLAAARRNLVERSDRVKLDVRDAFRSLEQARLSYEIQRNSLLLAERRVDSTVLLQQAGRASTRDVLEAREALLDAQDAVTRAMVDHFNAGIDLGLAMETLRIDDSGFWTGEKWSEDDEAQQL